MWLLQRTCIWPMWEFLEHNTLSPALLWTHTCRGNLIIKPFGQGKRPRRHGQRLYIVEAMKLQNIIRSPRAGGHFSSPKKWPLSVTAKAFVFLKIVGINNDGIASLGYSLVVLQQSEHAKIAFAKAIVLPFHKEGAHIFVDVALESRDTTRKG
jgi:hypothetical protein